MKEPGLRKLHRLMGIVIAPLIILRALSGVLLSVDWLLVIHRRAGDAIKENIPRLLVLWDMILMDIHYGMGVGGAFYHILLGVAAIGVATSGLIDLFENPCPAEIVAEMYFSEEDSLWKKRPVSILSISS